MAGTSHPSSFFPSHDLGGKVRTVCGEVLPKSELLKRETKMRAGQVEATRQSLQNSLSHLHKKEDRNHRDTEANLE